MNRLKCSITCMAVLAVHAFAIAQSDVSNPAQVSPSASSAQNAVQKVSPVSKLKTYSNQLALGMNAIKDSVGKTGSWQDSFASDLKKMEAEAASVFADMDKLIAAKSKSEVSEISARIASASSDLKATANSLKSVVEKNKSDARVQSDKAVSELMTAIAADADLLRSTTNRLSNAVSAAVNDADSWVNTTAQKIADEQVKLAADVAKAAAKNSDFAQPAKDSRAELAAAKAAAEADAKAKAEAAAKAKAEAEAAAKAAAEADAKAKAEADAKAKAEAEAAAKAKREADDAEAVANAKAREAKAVAAAKAKAEAEAKKQAEAEAVAKAEADAKAKAEAAAKAKAEAEQKAVEAAREEKAKAEADAKNSLDTAASAPNAEQSSEKSDEQQFAPVSGNQPQEKPLFGFRTHKPVKYLLIVANNKIPKDVFADFISREYDVPYILLPASAEAPAPDTDLFFVPGSSDEFENGIIQFKAPRLSAFIAYLRPLNVIFLGDSHYINGDYKLAVPDDGNINMLDFADSEWRINAVRLDNLLKPRSREVYDHYMEFYRRQNQAQNASPAKQ